MFWIFIKNGQNGSCKVCFDIPPPQTLNLPPLSWEVDLVPTCTEVYDTSWVNFFNLHCFDVALPNQHFNSSMTRWFFKSKWRDEALKIYFLNDTLYRENDTPYMHHSNLILLFQQILPWTQIWTQTFIVSYENPIFNSVKLNSCFRNQCWDAVKSTQALKKGCI